MYILDPKNTVCLTIRQLESLSTSTSIIKIYLNKNLRQISVEGLT